MNEYEKQAKRFLERTETTLEIKESAIQSASRWTKEGEEHGIKYDIKLSNKRGEYNFNFWGSIHDKMLKSEGKKAQITEYDVLACITKYEVGTFWDFINDFGYEATEETERTYNAVKEEFESISKLFTEEELEELREII